MGCDMSRATLARRMREKRGAVGPPQVQGPRAKPKPADLAVSGDPLPEDPDEIPEAATVPELTQLLARCNEALRKAEVAGNLPLVGQMIRVAASLAETIRKATPPERADPNEHPDMVDMGKRVAERLHKMVDLVAKGVV
jgi:hypothetical protein